MHDTKREKTWDCATLPGASQRHQNAVEYYLAAVRKGIEAADAGDTLSHEAVGRILKSWGVNIG